MSLSNVKSGKFTGSKVMLRDWKITSKNKNCKTVVLLAWQMPFSLMENDEKRLLEKGLCNGIFSVMYTVIQYDIFFSVDELAVSQGTPKHIREVGDKN